MNLERPIKQWLQRQALLFVVTALLVMVFYHQASIYTAFLSRADLYKASFIGIFGYAVAREVLRFNSTLITRVFLRVLGFVVAIIAAHQYLPSYQAVMHVLAEEKTWVISHLGIEAYNAMSNELVGVYGVFTSMLVLSRLIIGRALEKPVMRLFCREYKTCTSCGVVTVK